MSLHHSIWIIKVLYTYIYIYIYIYIYLYTHTHTHITYIIYHHQINKHRLVVESEQSEHFGESLEIGTKHK